MESGVLPPIVSQPLVGFSGLPPGAPGSGGQVSIRNLTNTPDDCAFAGRLSVEAFRSKMVHATSENSLPLLIKCMGKGHEGQDPVFYERYFIAECDNEKAGLMQIKFHDDPPERDNGAFNELGCCDVGGIICMVLNLSSSPSKGTCAVECLAVEDKFRGRGIGKILLDRAEYEAKKRGCHLMYLWVASNNRAIHLYERQGYEEKSCKCCCLMCAAGISKALRMEKPLQ